MIEFYDHYGSAVCYVQDDGYIYTWDGTPVAYVSDERIYAYNGRLLGWLTDGWLYDRSNRPALFSAQSSGGPIRPVRQVRPVKSVKSVRPVRSVRQVAHARPARSLAWSSCADRSFFDQ
jgi:hypothetical protein